MSTSAPATPEEAGGIIATGAGAAVAALRARAVEWDLAVEEAAGGISLALWGGSLRLSPFAGGGGRVTIRAPEKRLVQAIREAFSDLLDGEGIEVQWDAVEEGALAPGLSLMVVRAVTELSPGFLRVRLQAPDAARFGQGGLHFRLLLPPEGRAPRWPRIGANGRSQWPEGEDALHRPVYTVATQAGEMLEFDIFRHAGSPTCRWAEALPLGQEVGVMGPGGGWVPEAEELLLFGDETALPAIARILALTPGRARVWLRAEAEDLGALAGDPRVAQVEDLAEALQRADIPPEAHVWFAGPEAEARAARTHLAARGLPKQRFMAAAYWS